MNKYKWTLGIKVQGKNEAEAIRHIEDRIRAFVLRGASIKEGTLERVKSL